MVKFHPVPSIEAVLSAGSEAGIGIEHSSKYFVNAPATSTFFHSAFLIDFSSLDERKAGESVRMFGHKIRLAIATEVSFDPGSPDTSSYFYDALRHWTNGMETGLNQ